MKISKVFVCAGKEYNDFKKFIPAPLMRKNFICGSEPKKAEITICSPGFYRLFINGTEITKGHIAPYITDPDAVLFYDNYDITSLLNIGKNTVGIILGNGMMNATGGAVWNFHKAPWRNAPSVAFSIELTDGDGNTNEITSGEDMKTYPSPILMDDLRMGEYYDARNEIDGWNLPDFCDDSWNNCILAPVTRGDERIPEAEPIKTYKTLSPVSVRKGKINNDFKINRPFEGIADIPAENKVNEGWIYDFGINSAGVPTLKIKGERGQKVVLHMCEHMEKDGSLCFYNIAFGEFGLYQTVTYTLKGGEEEIYTPSFSYYGFRYCFVTGITEEQATESLITYNLMSSDLKRISRFECSDETANKLYQMTLNSDLSNFYYFPTDCPHREKNGWTGDAALSAEQLLMHFTPEKSFHDWLRIIVKSMRDDGALPGIVPTGGWGFGGWAGPAWDIVLVNLPYYLIQYRGDLEAAKIAAPAIMRYLNYLWTRRDENGLLAIGLGDWCPSGHINISHPAPLHFTDTVVSMDIANKAAVIFEKLGLMPQKAFAETIALELRKSAREYLIDKNTLTAVGNCQTTQAMALFYNLFDNGEKAEAYKVLKEFIAVKDDHMFAGILGARVLFRVLSDFGDADLAYKMITRPDGPSYGNWIERGATSLWEDFRPAFSNEERHEISKNHHFFGDISAWFISYICGIRINAALKGTDHVDIMPCFISSLQNAGGEHTLPSGKVSVEWERKDDKTITMKIEVPEGTKGFIRLPKDYRFEDTRAFIPLKSGEYTVTHQSVLSRLEYTF